jgi:hypothetical protein
MLSLKSPKFILSLFSFPSYSFDILLVLFHENNIVDSPSIFIVGINYLCCLCLVQLARYSLYPLHFAIFEVFTLSHSFFMVFITHACKEDGK